MARHANENRSSSKREMDAKIEEEHEAAQRDLASIAERVLALPEHLIDRAINQAWEDKIVESSDMAAVLSDWMDRLTVADPGFVRRVLEGWQRYLRDNPMAGRNEDGV